MQTSEARIQANRQNAQSSTGPKTTEGKERSRQNSLKHGLTGAGIVLSETDAAEVNRRTAAFAEELCAVGEVAQALVRFAALHSVRAERGADQQTAALTLRVRQVEADFVAPEWASDDEAAKLRDEAVRIAMFDPSKEAVLARRYEVAAERGFYKAIKLLRQMDKEADALLKADETSRVDAMMGSFLAYQQHARQTNVRDPKPAEPMPARPANFTQSPTTGGAVDVPFTIGRSR